MGLFGKSRAEKESDFDSQRAKEAADLASRTVEFPEMEMEVECEIWWDGGYYEKGSRNNDSEMETNIHIVLNKSRKTSKNNMSRSTQEIGYLVPKPPSEVSVMVFGKIVNKLKPKYAKTILGILNSPTPVKVWLGHCYENEDHGLPERYGTSIDLGSKPSRRKSASLKSTVKKKEVPVGQVAEKIKEVSVSQVAEKIKAFGSNQEVVGLSFYAEALESIVGASSDGSIFVKAVLKRNSKNRFDKNAVEVRVNDKIAGHIPRTDNLKYHNILDMYEKNKRIYECDALVCWETVNGLKEIRLDLKTHPNSAVDC